MSKCKELLWLLNSLDERLEGDLKKHLISNIKSYVEKNLSSKALGVNGVTFIEYIKHIRIKHDENILSISMPMRTDFIPRGVISVYGKTEKDADKHWTLSAEKGYQLVKSFLKSKGISKFEDEGFDKYEIYFISDDLMTL